MPPTNFFISVKHNFNTQKFVIKKKICQKCVLSFSFDWDHTEICGSFFYLIGDSLAVFTADKNFMFNAKTKYF